LPAERIEDVRQFNAAINALGLTTVYDVGRADDGDFSPVETLASAGQLNVRVLHTLRYSAYNPLVANGRTPICCLKSTTSAASSRAYWIAII